MGADAPNLELALNDSIPVTIAVLFPTFLESNKTP